MPRGRRTYELIDFLRFGGARAPKDLFDAIRDEPNPVWLDSALAHPRYGRRAILSHSPTLRFELYLDGSAALFDLTGELARWRRDGLAAFQSVLDATLIADAVPDLCGGWIGYLGYDLKNQLERLPPPKPDPLGLPAAWFGFYPSWWVTTDEQPTQLFLERRAWRPSRRWPWLKREHLSPDFWNPPPRPATTGRADSAPPHPRAKALVSNFKTRGKYESAVARIVDFIRAGDVFQVNLSQQFTAPFTGDPAALYLKLRAKNPAPFAAFLDLGEGRAIVSSSPERLFSIDGDRIETRPIKGTRAKLPHDAAGNRRRKAELMASEKDAAELAMIVDLERNDLGKICRPGSVVVEEPAALEEYATVYHRVATVAGQLRPGTTFTDVVRALFPGGSITGAPKIRAMEIIDELEPSPRGLYTGAIGYIGHGGRCDFNIAIRTLIVGDGNVAFNVGGGITADSNPAAEYDETLAKARGLIAALTE